METPRWFSISISSEHLLEFSKFNFAGSVFINLLNESLNVDCHLEFFFDGFYQFIRVDTAFSIWLSSHSHKGIEELGFVRAHDSLHFGLDDPTFEFTVRDHTAITWIDFRYHLINLIITQFDAYLLDD